MKNGGSWQVFVVEGGSLDGSVVLRDEQGCLLRLVDDKFVSIDDDVSALRREGCLIQASELASSYEDAATIGLFVAERERLIRAVSSIARKTGQEESVIWHGNEIAHVSSDGNFVRKNTIIVRAN